MQHTIRQCIALIAILNHAITYTDTITVHNRTNEPIFVRIYYQKNDQKNAESSEPITQIAPKDSAFINRPPRKKYQTNPPRNYDRNLVAAHADAALMPTLTPYELRAFAKVNVGTMQGDTFYFGTDTTRTLKGYTSAEWKIVKPSLTVARATIGSLEHYTIDQLKEYVRSHYKAAKNNPYQHKTATVTVGMTLSPDEQRYVHARTPLVKQALEQLLGRSLDGKYVPKIACVFSGGGHRAMISTLGSLSGCQDTGLMDAIMWNVGLSGSTWALASWLVNGLPIKLWSNQLYGNVRQHISKITPTDAHLLDNALMVKWAYNQPITLVDIYGGLLANRFFSYKGNDRQRIYLSAQKDAILQQGIPLPIFTAIQTGSGDQNPRWYEFSPYQIGSPELGMFIEPWAFGRKFFAGKSQDFAPEQTLGFLLGIFGAAFAAPYQQIYTEMIAGTKNSTTQKIITFIFDGIKKIIGEEQFEFIGQQRVKHSWAQVYNYSFGLRTSPINNQEFIRLTDAGIAFNLPYPPISGERPDRKADIMLLFDYSAGIHSASTLHGIENYARRKKLPLPLINYTDVTKKACTIFKDENNPTIPVVIYIPLIRDQALWELNKNKTAFKDYQLALDTFDPATCAEESFCYTTNMEYSKDQATQLAAHNEFIIKACKEPILEAIGWVIDTRSRA